VFYLNYWAIFDTAKGVFLWLDERTCLILSFFTKSALTDGAGWKSSSGVILGVRDGRMTWSIPLSSFSALVTGETSFILLTHSHIWADHARETRENPCLLAGAM